MFRLVNSKEITRYIAGPNQFLTAFPSFLFDIPSEEELITVTHCELLRISKSDLRDFSERSNAFSQIIIRLYEETILQIERRAVSHMTMNAKERFAEIRIVSPEFFDTIPNKILASYLGMEPETFSKIKSESESKLKE